MPMKAPRKFCRIFASIKFYRNQKAKFRKIGNEGCLLEQTDSCGAAIMLRIARDDTALTLDD